MGGALTVACMAELCVDKLLADKVVRDKFLEYAKKDLSEENLEFWIAVEEFKLKFSKSKDQKKLCEDLYELYLKDGAEKQVCIGTPMLRALRSALDTKGPAKDVFEDAQKKAFCTLRDDICPRFAESEEGMKILNAGKHNK